MQHILAGKPTFGQIATLLSVAAGGLMAARLLGARRVSGAERLASALLNTDRLSDANVKRLQSSAEALAGCAAYVVQMAYLAAEGVGPYSKHDDPIGHSRTETHAYTRAIATVLTEATEQDRILTYALTIPDVGELRGTRRIGGLHMNGLYPARPVPDTAQITLSEEYVAQVETEFEVADYVMLGRTLLFGSTTLRDNQGNVGHLHINHEGVVTGTITREARIIGRFEGRLAQGVQFKQYFIEGGS